MTAQWVAQLNAFGARKEPCFFIIDYTAKLGEVYAIENLNKQDILLEFPLFKSSVTPITEKPKVVFTKEKIDFAVYQQAFNTVMGHLKRGDSYLANLTFATPVALNLSLQDLYAAATAKYKVKYKDSWVCFSPETFVKVTGNLIATYPMKGTIAAHIPHAAHLLTTDIKERAEHSTIVDLLRNDLSQVAQKVTVKQLMYLDKVHTNTGDILQMSSEIVGRIENNWQQNMGSILRQLLPAGSISGAPKKKTLEIIAEAEHYNRGFYTGIAGYFDGQNLDTCVLIRYLENTNQGLVYKSGGGITAQSNVQKEYKELNQKIYVPIY